MKHFKRGKLIKIIGIFSILFDVIMLLVKKIIIKNCDFKWINNILGFLHMYSDSVCCDAGDFGCIIEEFIQ
jgi:hypothetical protein